MGLSDLHFTCPACDQETPVTPDNTILYFYEKQPIYNVVQFECPCGEGYRFFSMTYIVLDDDYSAFQVVRAEFAGEQTIREFAKIYFTQLAQEDEQQIQEFEDELACVANVDDIEWGDSEKS